MLLVVLFLKPSISPFSLNPTDGEFCATPNPHSEIISPHVTIPPNQNISTSFCQDLIQNSIDFKLSINADSETEATKVLERLLAKNYDEETLDCKDLYGVTKKMINTDGYALDLLETVQENKIANGLLNDIEICALSKDQMIENLNSGDIRKDQKSKNVC